MHPSEIIEEIEILLEKGGETIPIPSSLLEELLSHFERQGNLRKTAYTERNRFIALLSKVFPSQILSHSEGNRTRFAISLHLPNGEIRIPIINSDMWLFTHLTQERVDDLKIDLTQTFRILHELEIER
jgi:hypothetical protein